MMPVSPSLWYWSTLIGKTTSRTAEFSRIDAELLSHWTGNHYRLTVLLDGL
jgi:hypothetical protein